MIKYDTLTNNAFERRRITYSHVWWDKAFTNEQLDDIVTFCDESELEDGITIGAEDVESIKKVRRSKVKFFNRDNPKSDFIFTTFNYVAMALNNQYYNFNLNGYDNFQYTVYDGNRDAAEQGKYSWHMDLIMNDTVYDSASRETRKLTLILLLSEPGVDFTGGEFQLNPGNQDNPVTVDLPRGRIVAFPSWMIHQVGTVTGGIRKSIVVWIEGPKFV